MKKSKCIVLFLILLYLPCIMAICCLLCMSQLLWPDEPGFPFGDAEETF